MSVQIRSEDESIFNAPIASSVDTSIKPSVPELDVDRACRLLDDYREQLNSEISPRKNISIAEISYWTLTLSMATVILLQMLTGKISVWIIPILMSSIIFIRVWLFYKRDNLIDNRLYALRLYEEALEIANYGHRLQTKSDLSFWDKKELGIKLQRVESVLMDARKILKIKNS
jgi:hypothetical protein